jgi:flavin reductase (DIM6/NTAB) family NADH-FMN oxidoreductase RutF
MTTPKKFANALKKLEYGVYVVSMGKGPDGNAFTASWVSQVSSEPPLVSVAVHNKHQSARLLQDMDAYVINLIDAGQAEFAKRWYGPAESGYDKLKTAEYEDSPVTKTPVLAGGVGYIECKLVDRISVGDHTMFIGEVVAASLDSDKPVLTTSSSGLHYLG